MFWLATLLIQNVFLAKCLPATNKIYLVSYQLFPKNSPDTTITYLFLGKNVLNLPKCVHLDMVLGFNCKIAPNAFWVWEAINPFLNKPWFLHVCNTSLLKTLREKEKLLVTSNFSFSHSVFYLFVELSAIFRQIWNCRLQSLSVWNTLKFAVWERVK